MTKWQPIETCPENTWVLTYASWGDPPYVFITKFKWVERTQWDIESESRNEKGRRQIMQERKEREREWDTWGGDFWMPLPQPPQIRS
ncbi:MAG: hypothetical protein KGL39_20085 [Patescibacteria group bacterium]|nr:hypothetical protein [Patescibacteria group bacterium]